MTDKPQPAEKPKLRWYQYRLWHLFVLTAVVAIVMGVLVVPVNRARQQRAAIEALRELGWVVTCHPEPSSPAWARKVFGDEMFLCGVVQKQLAEAPRETEEPAAGGRGHAHGGH